MTPDGLGPGRRITSSHQRTQKDRRGVRERGGTLDPSGLSIMRKLDARNRVELAMWAYETGRIKS